jgi:rRNA processing protein Krr1/Pno1
VEIAAEDEPTLYTGGAESPIQKFQETYGAEMNVIRSRFVVVVKGQKPKVEAAVKRLRLFLHGGEGFTVARISVTEQALGVVIGKSGSKRAELEKKHEGVNLFIHRSNRITIRGPEDAVEACRVDILRLVSSVKVQQTMSLTPEEHEVLLSKPDALKRATYGIPVQVTVAEDSVKIRGFYSDVRDAQTFIKEVITGTYEAFIELEASELSCVRGACRDPSHFQRIQETSGAEIKLDLPSNSIIVCGKRSNVRKGKDLVVRFIEFLLPASFVRLKVSKPLHATVGEASALADLAASSGATITLDRDVNSIFIQSSDPEKVKKASDILKAKIKEAERFAFVISLEASDAWLIPLIIGKGGNRANTLRLDTGCHIDINKVDRTISVTGDDEANVAKAREQLENIIDESRRQCAFVELPEDLIAAFVGRGGSHIRSFSSENHVEIERMRKEPTKFKITGEEDNVEKASKAFKEWIDHWEMRQAGQTIAIEKSAIGAVLGKNGSVIDALQKEFNCKVEINREDLTLTVRGGTEEQREKAIEKISHIVGEDRERANGHGRRERGQHGNSNHQGDSHATNHDNSKPAPKSNDSMSTLDSRKDRSAEFATRPVGLTIVEKDASKPKNKKKNRNTNKGNNAQDISDEQTLQVGSSAGRSLFNLLVSETASNPEQQQHESSVSKKATAGVSLILNEEQWDSSTVSSAAIESSDPDDENGKNAGGAKPYIKSASGFTVRV